MCLETVLLNTKLSFYKVMYYIGAGSKGKSPMNWGRYIYSPGHFPKPFKPEEFADGSLESIPFNPKIVDVLFGDETIEKYATGLGRTFDSLKENDVAYDYTDAGNGFRFTFYRGSDSVNGGVNLTNRKDFRASFISYYFHTINYCFLYPLLT